MSQDCVPDSSLDNDKSPENNIAKGNKFKISESSKKKMKKRAVSFHFANNPYFVLLSIFHFSFFIYFLHSSLFTLHYSLFIIHCSLFIVHYSLFILHSSFFIIHFSLFIVHCSLFIIHYSLFIVHCSFAFHCSSATNQAQSSPLLYPPILSFLHYLSPSQFQVSPSHNLLP